MRLTVAGCSPAFPNPGGVHSGYLIEGAGSLLLDCGPGVLARLLLRGEWPAVDAIVLTHFHLDHCGDLLAWVWGTLGGAPGSEPGRTQLLVPPGGRAQLARLEDVFGARGVFARVFAIDEYEPGRELAAAGYSITAARVPHHDAVAAALRVTDGERTVAYSGDSGPSEELSTLAAGADLLVCEATLADGSLDVDPRGHLSLEEAEAVFAASGARRLLVTHRPAHLPAPERHELAHDGLVLEL